jgi:PfaB family protein
MLEQDLQSPKIAIVGMDAFFGQCQGLDTFECSIYDGKQHFIPLPAKRWHGIETQETILKEYGLPDGKAPVGAYITNFEIDTLAYKIPPNEVEKLNPQQLLLLTVTDRAIKDAKIPQGGNVAVIIAAETEMSVHQLQQRWNLSWQIKDGLNAAEIVLPDEKTTQLETIVKDSIHHQVDIGEYLSYINNIMASRISSLWNFTGPAFSLTAVETSVFKALEVAQMLLTTGEVDAVVVGAVDLAGGIENVLLRSQEAKINTGVNTLSFDQKADGWTIGEGAGAVVLKRYDNAKQNSDRIYAVIDAISIGQAHSTSIDASTIHQVCQQAFNIAGIQPTEVNYVEVVASGIPQQDSAEIAGLLQAYPPVGDGLHCAIGSVKANIGHTYVASGIASLIKTALCLYHNYIPATPNWTGVKTPQQWEGSPFFVATESRPWFLGKDSIKRIAAVNGMGCDGSYAHLILSDEAENKEHSSKYLQQRPYYLFPLAGDTQSELQELLNSLQASIENAASLSDAASSHFVQFQQRPQAKYALAITGRNQKELLKEIASGRKGINTAFERGGDWQTPIGSYFTAKPLGKQGSVAYIYPAAVNSYVGIGRTLFRLFPEIQDDPFVKSLYKRVSDVEKLVFPRSLSKLTTRQLEVLEKKLLDDSLAMFEAEMFCTRLLTTVIRDHFQVKPQHVFGYSLGETSMMVAQGVWSNFYEGSNSFNSSALFGDRLSGPKNAVREYWGLPSAKASDDNNFWCNYVLMATPSQVRECLQDETRVYLTQINTPEEVLIAGEPAACQRVIQKLGCNAFPAPFDHVIHCAAMQSEYSELVKLNTLPSQDIPGITFYSAAKYQPIALDNNAIAHSIATCLCQPLDFPQLVNRVYADGAKIFIEAGAGSVCSRWITKILEGQEHITVSLNRRGTDDHTAIVKALGKLLSHRVDLDLSSLYNLNPESSRQSQLTLRKITLGGDSITDAILSEEHQKAFHNVATKQRLHQTSLTKESALMSSPQTMSEQPANSSFTHNMESQPEQPAEIKMKDIMEHVLNPQEQLQSFEITTNKQQITQNILQPTNPTHELTQTINTVDLNATQYQQLSANNSRVTKAHIAFLQARQDFSQKMSEIIQLQLACAANLLNEDS